MMRKRRFLEVLILGAVVMASACSQKKEVTEKDLETISDKQLEERLEEADKSEGGKKAETKPETQNTEDAFNPDVPGLTLEDIDPYETNLFEIFGLDNDFPKPREDITSKWNYITGAFRMNEKTGETPEGVQNYNLYQLLKPGYYEDYNNEITEYIQEHYKDKGISLNEDGTERLILDGDYILESGIRLDMAPRQFVASLHKCLRAEIEGTVTEITTGLFRFNETGEEIEDTLIAFKLDMAGTSKRIKNKHWVNMDSWIMGMDSWGTTCYNMIYEWDQKLEVGDIVRIECIYDPILYSSAEDAISDTNDRWYLTNLEIIGKADTESSEAGE